MLTSTVTGQHAAVLPGTNIPIGQQPPTLDEGGPLEEGINTHAGAPDTHGGDILHVSPGAAAGVNKNPNDDGNGETACGPGQDTSGGSPYDSDNDDLFASSDDSSGEE